VYVGQENADSVAAIDVATQRVVRHIPVGQAPQALVFVANAVRSGAGTQNLTRQSVGLRLERRALRVPSGPNAKAKAVIRNLGPLDAVDITIRQAPAGAMMDVYAVENMASPHGRAVKLAHLMVKDDGTAEIGAQLRFWESGFTSVVLVPAGQTPAGATVSVAPVPVMVVALAGHCSMH
ncbi:MAG: hypothetical protein ACREOK_05270, partial [Gemmatimonadaceae bacterium]